MSAPAWLPALRLAAVAVHLLLIAGLWALILRSANHGGIFFAVIATLPLLAALPGLLRGSVYTGAWASLVAAFYGPLLLAEAYMQPHLRVALVVIACLGALDFVGLMLWVKASKRAQQA